MQCWGSFNIIFTPVLFYQYSLAWANKKDSRSKTAFFVIFSFLNGVETKQIFIVLWIAHIAWIFMAERIRGLVPSDEERRGKLR